MTRPRVVVGVDPGGRHTGIAVIDTTAEPTRPVRGIDDVWRTPIPALLSSTTVARPDVEGEPLTYVPAAYLHDVNAAILEAVRAPESVRGWAGDVDLIAVERVETPKGFAGGKRHTIDPAGLIAASIVLGAVLGRSWGIPVVAVRAGGNGHALPLDRYPAPLATAGKGHDRRRHERSAYDVAVRAASTPPALLRNGYTP